MSNNRLQMKGLTELIVALRHLPDSMTAEAAQVVDDAAEAARGEIVANYPIGPTGNLKAGVTKERNVSKFTHSAIVRSRAKHAHLWERGTQQRKTSSGANRGRMPEAPRDKQMIPVVIKHRRRMVEGLKALVRRAGFQVE